MSHLIAGQADVFSNARVKIYPNLDVLQVANAPIFRAAGWEARERAYDVPPKGEGKNPERAVEVSRARAKRAVKDIALCNHFDYFFTWTLDKKLIDRYDVDEVKRKLVTYLKNASHRKGFAYVLLPERHKDGAIHFHGLCKVGSFRLERACSPYTGEPLFSPTDRPLYNMPEWKWGFSSCCPIDDNYERAVNYVVKYLTKDSEKIFGKWYLSSRNLVKRPDIKLVSGGMDYYAFANEHQDCSPIPLYNDVKLISCSLSEKGGIAV